MIVISIFSVVLFANHYNIDFDLYYLSSLDDNSFDRAIELKVGIKQVFKPDYKLLSPKSLHTYNYWLEIKC